MSVCALEIWCVSASKCHSQDWFVDELCLIGIKEIKCVRKFSEFSLEAGQAQDSQACRVQPNSRIERVALELDFSLFSSVIKSGPKRFALWVLPDCSALTPHCHSYHGLASPSLASLLCTTPTHDALSGAAFPHRRPRQGHNLPMFSWKVAGPGFNPWPFWPRTHSFPLILFCSQMKFTGLSLKKNKTKQTVLF